jgi:predicted nucleic acid-binding protein
MSDGADGAASGADERLLLVDASVLITLADVGAVALVTEARGTPVVPWAVVAEVRADPARRALATAVKDGRLRLERADRVAGDRLADAAPHLGAGDPEPGYAGDVALLALAMAADHAVVVSDDGPLPTTCKALSVPLSGSIGLLIRAVERGDRSAETATDTLLAMDEVGARLGARLLRRAEDLIEDASGR